MIVRIVPQEHLDFTRTTTLYKFVLVSDIRTFLWHTHGDQETHKFIAAWEIPKLLSSIIVLDCIIYPLLLPDMLRQGRPHQNESFASGLGSSCPGMSSFSYICTGPSLDPEEQDTTQLLSQSTKDALLQISLLSEFRYFNVRLPLIGACVRLRGCARKAID
jgi:hypothetical protein